MYFTVNPHYILQNLRGMIMTPGPAVNFLIEKCLATPSNAFLGDKAVRLCEDFCQTVQVPTHVKTIHKCMVDLD